MGVLVLERSARLKVESKPTALCMFTHEGLTLAGSEGGDGGGGWERVTGVNQVNHLNQVSKRGIFVKFVIWVIPEHPNSKIANSMKSVNYAFFSSQGNIFELKNVKANLIAPNSNKWCLFKENPLSRDDRKRLKF